jgi:hypothetical protein
MMVEWDLKHILEEDIKNQTLSALIHVFTIGKQPPFPIRIRLNSMKNDQSPKKE